MVKKWLPILLILSIFLIAAVPQQSTTDLHISQMEINIWPEYDRSAVLVIYRISFTSLTSFPAQVDFRIPATAGDPYSVAMKDLDGLLYDLEYSIIPDGAWNRVEFISSTPNIQLEFYDPFKIDGSGNHAYKFHWICDYPIDNLKVVIQKPKYASSMTINPDFGAGQVNPDDGLTYYTNDVGSVNQGQAVNVSLSYSKTNSLFSASTLPVRAANSYPTNMNFWQVLSFIYQPVIENNSLLTGGIFLLAGLVLIFLIILLSTHKKKPVPEISPRSEPGDAVGKRFVTSEQFEVYCHVCGKRARPGDIFCRACGSKLQIQ